MGLSVRNILPIGAGANTSALNNLRASYQDKFIQAATAAQPSLDRPESRNSIPYGDSPFGKNLYLLG